MTASTAIPKVFISYSWSGAEHELFVQELAIALRNNGVDAILDKWRLKPGQDKYVFMESMVTDPGITRVLVLCDKKYQERADVRAGGVGTESQIISAALYKKVDQTKFIPILCERGPDGEEYLPVFLKGRMYVDLSSNDAYGTGLDQLLRLIYDKPLHAEPELGQTPSFLAPEGSGYPLARELASALRAIKEGRPGRQGLELLFVRSVFAEVQRLYVRPKGETGYDEEIYQAIQKTKGLRDQVSEYADTVAVFVGDDPAGIKPCAVLLELLGQQFGPPEEGGYFVDTWADLYKFFALEVALIVTAALLRHERWLALRQFMKNAYLVRLDHSGLQAENICVFDTYIESMDQHRNNRMQQRRICLTADMLKERASPEHTSFAEIAQADTFLGLFSVANLKTQGEIHLLNVWRPRTSVWGQDVRKRPVFLKAVDPEFRAGIWRAIGVSSGRELAEKVEKARPRLDDFKNMSLERMSRNSFETSVNMPVLLSDQG